MKYLITAILMIAATIPAEDVTDAQAVLIQARAALEAGRFNEAFQHAARVQALYYRDADAMAAALYVEVMTDQATGGSCADVSALTELKTLYPDSVWCRKAIGELEKTEQATR